MKDMLLELADLIKQLRESGQQVDSGALSELVEAVKQRRESDLKILSAVRALQESLNR